MDVNGCSGLHKCLTCSKEYKTLKGLNKHTLICNMEYTCVKCQYTTKDKSHHTRHLNSNKCKFNKTATCEKCNKSFRDKYDLNRHNKRKIPCVEEPKPTVVNKFILNVNSLNEIDKMLYTDFKNGKNIEDYIPQFIEAAKTIKRRKPKMYKVNDYHTEEDIEDMEESYLNQCKYEDSIYVNNIFDKVLFNGDQMPFLKPY